MLTQEQTKIEELSDKNRNLMDAVSRLERELRTVQGLYSRAAKEAFELGEVVKTQQATIEQLMNPAPVNPDIVQNLATGKILEHAEPYDG